MMQQDRGQAEYASLTNVGLEQLFRRVEAESLRMDDLVIPSRALHMDDTGHFLLRYAPGLNLTDGEITAQFGPLDAEAKEVVRAARLDRYYSGLPLFHSHLARKLEIPLKYYRRMEGEHLALRQQNVNHWLQNHGGNFLMRTLAPPPGAPTASLARALLSDSYLILNNHDVIVVVLQTARDLGINFTIRRCDLTERRMYVTFEAPEIGIDGTRFLHNYINPDTGEGGGGTENPNYRIMAGFTISNSEVGQGAFQVMPRPFAPVCMNCFTYKRDGLRRTHLGEKMEHGAIRPSERTLAANFELITSQLTSVW